MTEISEKEVEAAMSGWHRALIDAPNESVYERRRRCIHAALEAAARVRAEAADGGEVVASIPLGKGNVIDSGGANISQPLHNKHITIRDREAHPAPQPSGAVEALKRITQAKEVRRGGGVFDYEPVLSAGEMYEIALDALSSLTAGKPHPDDEAVDRFAAAMKAKLKWEREERGRHGWNDPEVCSEKYLARLLIEHLAKGNEGNFEDIANLCMMLHQRGAHPRVLADALTAKEKRS